MVDYSACPEMTITVEQTEEKLIIKRGDLVVYECLHFHDKRNCEDIFEAVFNQEIKQWYKANGIDS